MASLTPLKWLFYIAWTCLWIQGMVTASDDSYECEAEKLRTQNITLWCDFLSFYSQFYEVIIHEGTYAIGEGKMQSVSLVVKLSL
jgi:hypothetical protein